VNASGALPQNTSSAAVSTLANVRRVPAHQGLERTRLRRLGGKLNVLAQITVPQDEGDVRFVGDVGELAPAQQRHGGHRDSAHLHHGEPARHHHGIVRRPQHDAMSRHDAEIIGQYVRDPVRRFSARRYQSGSR